MKKQFILLIAILLCVTGCTRKEFEFSHFVSAFTDEFSTVKKTELITEANDKYLNKDGYYKNKVIMQDETNQEIINIELFDNQTDLDNRITYLTAAIESGRKQFYEDLEHVTGGYSNIDNIKKALGTTYFEEEHYEQVGPLLLRIPKSNRKKYDYIEFVEQYLNEYKLDFANANKKHYDIDEEIASIPDIKDVLKQEFDSLYDELIVLKRESIEKVLQLESDEAVKYSNNTINTDVFGKIPLFLEKFSEDDSFEKVHKHLEKSKQEVEEKETEIKQAKKEAEKREKEAEKRKEEQAEKEEKLKNETEYISELSRIFNKNGASGSSFTVTRDNVDGEEVIKITQTITDNDLKEALGLNLVKGLFKEETHYMLKNLRQTINTTANSNPTPYGILYIIKNPYNKDNFVYVNFEGLEIHNDFNE